MAGTEGEARRAVRALRAAALALGAALAAPPGARGAEVSGRLFIVTSFPQSLFAPFEAAFEARHPAVRVHVRNRKTSAAVSFIEERLEEPVDLFWASAPDAFELLKRGGHLLRLEADGGQGSGPGEVAGYPLDDPDGYYRGFAISGYGIMWSEPYLARLGLAAPRGWDDLRGPAWRRHLGISAPSRSGTTHVIVETLLQARGWEAGWATLLEIGGNLATVTARSFGVLEGVTVERFGAGLVIDFFALSAQARGAPVAFLYPEGTAFLPANIAIVARGRNREAARAFIAFVRSPAGQRLLLDPAIRRLPLRPAAYREAPPGYPNPFAPALAARAIRFDSRLSRNRYHLVNALFDALITYRLRPLRRAWQAIHEAEAALAEAGPRRAALAARLARARTLASSVPVSAAEARDPALAGVFVRHKPGLAVPARQRELEAEWERFARARQGEAARLAREVLAALERGEPRPQ